MKERVHKSSIFAILVVAIVAAFTFAMTAFSPKVLAEGNNNTDMSAYTGKTIKEVRDIDPNYPDAPEGKPYTLTVPKLDDRLTVSGNTGTLFAPYTKKTLESDSREVGQSNGLYDVQKVFRPEPTQYGSINDSGLCWAASDSNLVAWYLDSMAKANYHPELLNGKERDVNKIFYQFKNVWGYEPDKDEYDQEIIPDGSAVGVHGYDPTFGLSWYFTGAMADRKHPLSKNPNSSGGFLRDLPYQSYSAWLDLGRSSNGEILYGSWDYNKRRAIMPLASSADGKSGNQGNLSTLENFSKTIVQQLHYGPTTIGVTKAKPNSNFAHAVTLWGCDYDIKTGLVTKIYLTDSDDPDNNFIREVAIKAKQDNANGISMEYNGHHRGGGDEDPFKSINLSAVLYAPGAVQPKDAQDIDPSGGDSGNHGGGGGSHYVPDDGIEQVFPPVAVKCDANGNVAIMKPDGEDRILEYGYTQNVYATPTNWQKTNIFNGLKIGEVYYFYMRVAATDTSPAGGLSEPYKFTLRKTDGVLPPPVENKVTVRVVNGNGEYTQSVKVGGSVPVYADTKPGYTFSHWEVNGVYKSSNISDTFIANQNMTIVAKYTQNTPPPPKPSEDKDIVDLIPIVPGDTIEPDIKPSPSEDKDIIDLIPIAPGESVDKDSNTTDNTNGEEQPQKPSGDESISQDNSLSSGAVAGIAVGSVAGIGAIGVGVFFLIKFLRRRI